MKHTDRKPATIDENFAKSAKLSLTIGWLAVSNVVLVVGFQWYVVTRLGIGIESDALFASIAVPQMVLAVATASFVSVLVPIFATRDAEAFRRDSWTVLLVITGLFTALALVLEISAGWFVPILVTGFSPRAKALTVTLTRIQFASLSFAAAASVLSSLYQARRKFIWVELTATLSNLAAFVLVVLTLPLYGVKGAACSLVAGNALPLIFLARAPGRWQTPDLRSDILKELYHRLRPILLGALYYKTDPLVDRFLLSMGATGGISLLYLGQQIFGATNQVLGKAVVAPVLPGLAIEAKARQLDAFKSLHRTRIAWIAALTLPLYVGIVAGGRELLRLFVGQGSVTAEDVHLLWLVMIALGGLLIGGALGQMTSLAFYAKGDTRTPTRLGVWTYTLYVPVKIFAFLRFGLVGVAASISLFVLANFVLQFIQLEQAQLTRVDKTNGYVAIESE
jgi:putative peptidoglycan lipid II flippase